MDEFTPEFIAEQLALAAKATPRPWRTWDSERGFIGIANNEAVDLGTASRADDVCIISEEVNDHHNKEDAAYITAAANNYPAALEEIARLREAQRWIPVSERLPEPGEYVNVKSAAGYIDTLFHGYGDDNTWYNVAGWNYHPDSITHWMPLPEPPQEAEG